MSVEEVQVREDDVPLHRLGDAGEAVVRELRRDPERTLCPVAIVDDSAPPETETEGVALVSPSGWRIEGLTVTQAVEAARRLG